MSELKCNFIQNLPVETGTGKNGQWVKNQFVTETTGQFPVKQCFAIWGDKSSMVANLKHGQEILVKFDLSSREYNGRWFTEAKAFAIETGAVQAAPQQSAAPVQSVQQQFNADVNQGGGDQLPF